MFNVVLRHTPRRKSLLEASAYTTAIEFAKSLDCPDSLGFVLYDETGHPVVEHFRDRAPTKRDDRRAAGHGFNHHETERLRPINWKQQRGGIREKSLFRLIIDFADQLNLFAVDLR